MVYIALDEGPDYYRIYGERMERLKNIIMILLLMNLVMYLTL